MKKLLVICISFFTVISLFAQEVLKSNEEEYYDFLYLKGLTERPTLGYRTLSDSVWDVNEETNHVWSDINLGSKYTLFQPENVKSNFFLDGINQNIKLKIYGPHWFNSYNTASPYGQNDGGLWQGRGYNTSFSAGVRVEGYGFELSLRPEISFSQNLPFEYLRPIYGNYGYFSSSVDLVQRYGDKAFWNFDWGDSEIRYSFYNFTIGFGTQIPWLGPAWLNPMLGSNNAGSYPKLDFGFRKTKLYIPFTDIYLGDFEARAFIGRLKESEYFDKNEKNDYRMLNALSVSYAPSFIPGLTLGANRIFITNWKKDKLKYFGRLFTLSSGNDVTGDGEDQKVSIFANWAFPQIGFEVYGEYGFDDFTSDLGSNLFHTGIYTVGVKQNIPLPGEQFDSTLIFEWNNFEMSQDFQLQWQYTGYYAHGQISQGYTNNGQILGAGTGFFGNSQFLGYKFYYPKGNSMFYIHRYCPNNNYIYNFAVDTDASHDSTTNDYFDTKYGAYEAYYVYGLTNVFYPLPSLQLSGDFAVVYIHNHLYDIVNRKDLYNFNFKLGVKYSF